MLCLRGVLETRLEAGVRDLLTSTSDDAILKSLRLVRLLFWCFIHINVNAWFVSSTHVSHINSHSFKKAWTWSFNLFFHVIYCKGRGIILTIEEKCDLKTRIRRQPICHQGTRTTITSPNLL